MTPRRSVTVVSSLTTMVKALLLVARGLFAAAIGTGALAGLPWALVHYAGWPLPSSIPTTARLRADVTSPILGDAFYLHAIAIVLWFLWTLLAVSFAMELVAAVRRVPVPHLPGLGPAQALTAFLVTAIGVTALLGRSAAPARAESISATPQARTPATAPAIPAAHRAEHDAAQPVTLAQAHEHVHHVKPGDTLFSIAAADLGNGEDWPTLYRLNAGIPQPDEQRLTNPDLIRPGWNIRITDQPTRHSTHRTAPPAAPSTRPSHPETDAPAHPAQHSPSTPAPTRPITPATPAPARPGHHPATAPAARPADPHEHHADQTQTSPLTWVELSAGGAIALGTALALRAALKRKRTLHGWHASCYWPTPGAPPAPAHDEMPPSLRPARTITLLPVSQPDTGVPMTDEPEEPDAPTAHAPADETAAAPEAARHPSESGIVDHGALQPAVQDHPIEAGDTITSIPVALADDGAVLTLNGLGSGIGVSGPGALAAARAIAAAVLTSGTLTQSGGRLLIPRADAAMLLDTDPQDAEERLTGISDVELADDLDQALGFLEEYLTYRTRQLAEYDSADLEHLAIEQPDLEDHPPVVLMAVARPDLAGRLSASMVTAARLDLHAVLFGTHPDGVNWRIDADNQITSEELTGSARAFTISPSTLRQTLTLLASTDRHANRTLEPITAPDPHGPLAEPDNQTTEPTPTHTPDESTAVAAPNGAASEEDAPGQAGTPDHTHGPAASAQNQVATAVDNPDGQRQEPPASVSTSDRQDLPEAAIPAASVTEEPAATPPRPAIQHDLVPAFTTPDANGTIAEILTGFDNAAARIRVLGHLSIETASGPVETGIRSGARRLAGRLAVHHHRGQSGDELAELWPDLDPKKLTDVRKTDLKSLRDALKRDVRKGTGAGRSAEFIPRLAGRYRLDPRFVAVDLAAFEQLRTLAARATDPAVRTSAAEAALTFYDRELLASNDEEWTLAPRAAIRRDALSTATLLAQLAEADSDHERALTWWERARHIDDNEEVYRQIMRTQAKLGRRADMLATRDLLIAKLEPIGEYLAPATRTLLADMAERRT